MRPDEAAEAIQSGETPSRFQNELSDEDLMNMNMGDYEDFADIRDM